MDQVQGFGGQPQLLADGFRVGGHAHRVPLGVGILRFECHGQRDDHAHEEVLQILPEVLLLDRDAGQGRQILERLDVLGPDVDRPAVVDQERPDALVPDADRGERAPVHPRGEKELARPGIPLRSLEQGDLIPRVERFQKPRARDRERVVVPFGQPAVRHAEDIVARGVPDQDRDPVRVEQRPHPFDHGDEWRGLALDLAQGARDLIQHAESRERARKLGGFGDGKGSGRSASGLHGPRPPEGKACRSRSGTPLENVWDPEGTPCPRVK